MRWFLLQYWQLCSCTRVPYALTTNMPDFTDSFNRSPGLATLSGCAGIFVSLVTMYTYLCAPEDAESTGEVESIFLIPMLPTLYTGPYILRGFRLLIMYNPRMRKRWGAFVKERALQRAMVACCVVNQVISWTCVLFFGIEQ